jgi:Arc/MetJ family transcription regulator
MDDELLEKARQYLGFSEKTALVREALHALIQRECACRLANLGGSCPDLKPVPRRRSSEA